MDNLREYYILHNTDSGSFEELITSINEAFKKYNKINVAFNGSNKNGITYNIDMTTIKGNASSELYIVLWTKPLIKFLHVEANTDDNNTIILNQHYGANITLKASPVDNKTWNLIAGYGYNIS